MLETSPIRHEGSVLEWTTSIKHIGNYIRNDLSEYDEIRHKPYDFVRIFNGLLARYHDATPEVLTQLTSSYCTHRYGSQAWLYNDTNEHRMFTTWNKAIRRIWNLPTHSERVLLCGLNEGNNVCDYILIRIIKMYNSMKCNDDNDNDNILFDHNLQIEITIYNSLENQIINTLVWRLLFRQNNLAFA